MQKMLKVYMRKQKQEQGALYSTEAANRYKSEETIKKTKYN